MQLKQDPTKTLGPRAAEVLMSLHQMGRQRFTIADVANITGQDRGSTRSFVRKLVDRGLATRLRPGLFVLVPFELGHERQYMGNPYLVAREMMRDHPYYLSHASAMDVHHMVTQPQLVVYVTSTHTMRARTILGTDFRFIHCRHAHLFGTTNHWLQGEKVVVSDMERTIIDGLRQPQYSGGITEVAKGLWIRHEDMSITRLVEYAMRLDVGAVAGRLGHLLELYALLPREDAEKLRTSLTASYALLDPLLPSEGAYCARWRLRLNLSNDELNAATQT